MGSSHDSIDISGLGEILILTDRPAITISFSSTFWAEHSNPQKNIDRLIKWKNSKKPVHLIVTGFKINLFCAITSLSYDEEGGDVGSINYSIKIKEYREPKVRKIKVQNAIASTTGGATRVDNRVTPTTYTIKSGDCLYNIAKAQLGNAQRWTEIASLNGISSPYLIHANQNIKLPR